MTQQQHEQQNGHTQGEATKKISQQENGFQLFTR